MTNERRVQTDLLLQAGKLLLEFNESSGAIIRTLETTARKLTGERCRVVLSYRGLAVSLGQDNPSQETVTELRYNSAVQTRIHQILDEVRGGDLTPSSALACLSRVEVDTPRHSRWLAALLLGAAAASFAQLLGADAGATVVAGVAAGVGLLARQELGRRHASLLALPLAAAFIGALLGGLAIRQGWTSSPELVLVVPALMLVPGPHLINGLFDLIDNQVPMSLSRFGLAAGILLASSLGIVLGVELTDPQWTESPSAGAQLNLFSDMLLAGIATCGFAVFYNTPWRNLGIVAAGGMAGHGVRYLALASATRPEAAAFLGGLTVGALSALMARRTRSPVAVIAFAGAVTMIPGLTLYRALAGALHLARFADGPDAALVARTFSNAFQGCWILSGLGLGLIIGARVVIAAFEERSQIA